MMPEYVQQMLHNMFFKTAHTIKYLPSELYVNVRTRCDDHDIDLVFRNVLWAWLNVKYLNFGYIEKKWYEKFELTVEHVNRYGDFGKITNCTSVVTGVVSIRIRYI